MWIPFACWAPLLLTTPVIGNTGVVLRLAPRTHGMSWREAGRLVGDGQEGGGGEAEEGGTGTTVHLAEGPAVAALPITMPGAAISRPTANAAEAVLRTGIMMDG